MPTHSETRFLPYTAQQMYDLVADVGSYPKFLPWNAAARIRSRLSGQPPEVLAIMFPYWVAISALMLPFAVLTVFAPGSIASTASCRCNLMPCCW